MVERGAKYFGDVSTVSNELELNLKGVTSSEIINVSKGELEIDPEVNKVDIVELLVSMADDAEDLNSRLEADMDKLLSIVQGEGGQLYSGSSLLRDVNGNEPAWYRTTSLSYTLANELMDITSQQIVIGVAREGMDGTGEQFGLELHDFLRKTSPIILALSASSPYKFEEGELVDTRCQSRRVEQYKRATEKFPSEILDTPSFRNIAHYWEIVQEISNEVNRRLEHGQMDHNHFELYREREGKKYAPFDTLDPHQVYWMIRPRPDHANEDSVFSLEVRVSDIPISVDRMQAINSFILGLSYYAARHGFSDLNETVSNTGILSESANLVPVLSHVAKAGLDAKVGNNQKVKIETIARKLVSLSSEGLVHRGMDPKDMVTVLENIMCRGNDAVLIRQQVQKQEDRRSNNELENFLSSRLSNPR